MKRNVVKQKLRRGEATFGTWLSLGNLHAARVLARSGLDWLTVDLEHAAVDWSQAAALFAVIADAGCTPLCRVPEASHVCIKRALDAGAFGVVVPMVNSVEQAQLAIAAAKYPPQGNRGVGGGMHVLNFAADAMEYYMGANEEILVVLQTETPAGVEQAEAIYALPGCDAIFVGPNDLWFNMRTADGREPSAEAFESMVARVVAAGKKTGTPTGMHVMTAADAQRRKAEGMQFIAVGSDLTMMAAGLNATLEQLRLETPKGAGPY
jgi:4-hydroxy-2-oxoheptanedioate aldolase